MATVQQVDFHVDLLAALLWCQDDATRLQAIMRAKQNWYDTNAENFWQDWHRDVFNIDTANRFGLNVWAIILGIDLSIDNSESRRDKPTFGFGPDYKNFQWGNFSNILGGISRLTDENARLLLKLRYRQLTSRPTVVDINRMLKEAFSSYGRAWVLDPLDMSFVIYTFDFEPGQEIRDMMEHFDLLPRPSGVGVAYRVVSRIPFGFGPHNENFDNGNFYPIERT